MLNLKVVKWAAEECERQRVGPVAVWRLLAAWDALQTLVDQRLVEDVEGHIIRIAHIVDPTVQGYRTVPVYFSNGGKGMVPDLIPDAMLSLLRHGGGLTPDEWYYEFETIHPFRDGNGRVGSLYWNLKRGTLHDPEVPPDFWGPTTEG